MSISFGLFYCLVTVLEPTFAPLYGFTSGSVGLAFLGGGIGNLLGALTCALTLDRLHMRLVGAKRAELEKNGIEYKHGMLSEQRLIPSPIAVFFIVVGFIFYGWFLQAKFFWIAPLIGMGICKLQEKGGRVAENMNIDFHDIFYFANSGFWSLLIDQFVNQLRC